MVSLCLKPLVLLLSWAGRGEERRGYLRIEPGPGEWALHIFTLPRSPVLRKRQAKATQEVADSLEPRVTGSCVQPCTRGCCKPNSDLLQEQCKRLTSEPPLQPDAATSAGK